jgi:peptidylprolyl isomerase
MNSKLSSIAILAAFTTAAAAQTTPATPAAHTATHHTTTSATSKTATNIPKVVGLPKTLYALKYIDTHIGTGPLAQPSVLGASQAESKIWFYTVRYTGWLTDGTKFDSSYDHPGGEPITFPAGVHRVIPGWDSGFQGMHVGGKRRLFIPWQLAYGEAGRPPRIPAKADLIFDIELVSQSNTPPQPPAAPAAPAAPKPESTPPPSSAPQPPTPPTSTAPATPAQPQTPPHPQAF